MMEWAKTLSTSEDNSIILASGEKTNGCFAVSYFCLKQDETRWSWGAGGFSKVSMAFVTSRRVGILFQQPLSRKCGISGELTDRRETHCEKLAK